MAPMSGDADTLANRSITPFGLRFYCTVNTVCTWLIGAAERSPNNTIYRGPSLLLSVAFIPVAAIPPTLLLKRSSFLASTKGRIAVCRVGWRQVGSPNQGFDLNVKFCSECVPVTILDGHKLV